MLSTLAHRRQSYGRIVATRKYLCDLTHTAVGDPSEDWAQALALQRPILKSASAAVGRPGRVWPIADCAAGKSFGSSPRGAQGQDTPFKGEGAVVVAGRPNGLPASRTFRLLRHFQQAFAS